MDSSQPPLTPVSGDTMFPSGFMGTYTNGLLLLSESCVYIKKKYEFFFLYPHISINKR